MRGIAMRMYASLWLLLSTLAACAAADPEPTTMRTMSTARPEAPVERALPADRSAQHIHRGDLDGDGDDDALVVTLPSSSDEADRRGIVLFLYGADGWRIAARNDHAVPCAGCGGAMGDPLAGVDIVPGGFVLRFEGGSRELWSVAYGFRHDAARARWRLDTVDRKLLDRATGAAKKAHAGPGDIGQVDFTGFDPGDETPARIG
jgi:hypothetical protein